MVMDEGRGGNDIYGYLEEAVAEANMGPLEDDTLKRKLSAEDIRRLLVPVVMYAGAVWGVIVAPPGDFRGMDHRARVTA